MKHGGPGNSTSGESLSGLARAFFFAGARAMLVTHWSINDQTSAFLVADTLRRLVAGQDGGLAGALPGPARDHRPGGQGSARQSGSPVLLGTIRMIGEGGSEHRAAITEPHATGSPGPATAALLRLAFARLQRHFRAGGDRNIR